MSKERPAHLANGYFMLLIVILMFLVTIGLFIGGIFAQEARQTVAGGSGMAAAVLLFISTIVTCNGFLVLLPNEAGLLTLFGSYSGTARESGFWWANPFMMKRKLSLRSRNLEGGKLKVNDKQGNPIEIAVVVVWRIEDTAQAAFDVENFETYVRIQSETAVRHLANSYAYDHGEANEITLRSGVDEVSAALRDELQERLSKAGVYAEEARLTHLAYAPEIAQAMLRRQQAEAVIAARKMIVHGAVSMVQMALQELVDKNIVVFDEERKAAMVSNLLVVLCGEAEVHPVINTGTLYN
ncbi:MAG: SPFH domain-containing protein [Gemmataceae bacterium]|nr:SPFH domain-containing protein [Gemmataceae bacterium]